MKKRILFSVAVFFLVFATVSVIKIKAGNLENVTGWSWGGSDDGAGNSGGIGWISANSTTGGGGVSYGVHIPSDGSPALGYAWSENVGWIDFAPVGPYPAAPDNGVKRIGNDLDGWARILAMPEAGANAGGWLGWIKMKGNNYGVSIDPTTGDFSGYAWSDELGYIKMKGNANDGSPYITKITPPPAITLSASPLTINVDSASLPQNTTLAWSVTNATNCTANSTNGSWTGSKNNINGSESVQITSAMPTVDFTLTCDGPGGNSSDSINVTTFCYEHSCASGTCAATPKYGVVDSAACTTQLCTNDSQCAPVTTRRWQEVAP